MNEKAAAYVREYLTVKHAIDDLEARAEDARQAAIECLAADGAEPGFKWKFAGLGVVSVVKGRVSEKLDRTVLAKHGIDPALLDAATRVTVGKVGIRITRWSEEDGDGA